MARNDAEYNRYIIAKFVRGFIRANGHIPTIREIADEVNLTEATVSKHMKGLKFAPQKHRLRLLTDDVLASIYAAATDGKVTAQRLWLEVMEGWAPPAPTPDTQATAPMPPPQTAYYQAEPDEEEE